jgi:hypothetical protein
MASFARCRVVYLVVHEGAEVSDAELVSFATPQMKRDLGALSIKRVASLPMSRPASSARLSQPKKVSAAGVTMSDIYRGMWPFVAIQMLDLVLCIASHFRTAVERPDRSYHITWTRYVGAGLVWALRRLFEFGG